MHSVIATLLALVSRDRDGQGVMVEAAMVEAALNAAAEQVVEYGSTGIELMREGNRGPDAAPQGVYPCAGTDNWVALAVTDDDQWPRLCEVLGLAELATPDLATEEGRRARHDEIDDALAASSATYDAEELADRLTAAGIPAAVVINATDISKNEQLRWRGLFETEHHPVTGDHEIPVLPFRFSHVERWLRAATPTLGQDNEEILRELGLDADAIADLREHAVIGERPPGS